MAFGIIEDKTLQRLLKAAAWVEQQSDRPLPDSRTVTTRDNVRQIVYIDALDSPASHTDAPTNATARLLAPTDADSGSALEELSGDDYVITVYNHDPSFSAAADDYGRVRRVSNEYQPLAGGGSGLWPYQILYAATNDNEDDLTADGETMATVYDRACIDVTYDVDPCPLAVRVRWLGTDCNGVPPDSVNTGSESSPVYESFVFEEYDVQGFSFADYAAETLAGLRGWALRKKVGCDNDAYTDCKTVWVNQFVGCGFSERG